MINFKTATVDDATSISQLVNSAYRGESSKEGWTTEADLVGGTRTTPQNIEKLIQSSYGQFEMAYDQSHQLIACVYLLRENEMSLYFGMLTTLPALQGKGLGKKMIKHIEDLASSEKRTVLRMTVLNVRKELIDFYERRGFKPTGHFDNFPENNPDFGIPKVSGLKLLEFIKNLNFLTKN